MFTPIEIEIGEIMYPGIHGLTFINWPFGAY